MRKKNYKGRCEKVSRSKCKGGCKTYDPIQMAYAMMLQADKSITEFWCNVSLDTEEYTTDFLCTKENGEQMVRECVQRSHLTKPMTVKLLDISREYWLSQGVSDITINKKKTKVIISLSKYRQIPSGK